VPSAQVAKEHFITTDYLSLQLPVGAPAACRFKNKKLNQRVISEA